MQLEKKSVETRMLAANLNMPIPILKLTLIEVFKLVITINIEWSE